jgi:membrane-associated protease RseP (regulator of RpoE activity)
MSLILATGDLASAYGISQSVIICDGDVRVCENVVKSLIIARGSVMIEGWGYQNTLIAGREVIVKKPVPLPNGQQLPKGSENIIEEYARRPLGYITFFELSTVGVEVKLADKAVQVTAVADSKPFAEAGVRVGDIVAEVNGKKPDSAESLRRLLRDALAIGDATVILQRGGRTKTVKISLPD